MESGKLNNIIPLGNVYASMPIGAIARIGVVFALWPKPVPKLAAPLLSLLCEKVQKANLYNEGEQRGVEVSSRELAKELTPPLPGLHVIHTTVAYTLNWLNANEWINIDTRKKGQRSVVTINIDKIKQFITPSQPETKIDDTAVWQECIDRTKKQECIDKAESNGTVAPHGEVKRCVRIKRHFPSAEVKERIRRSRDMYKSSIENEEVYNV